MINEPRFAKIFLNEQRGCTQTENFRCFYTFNFESFHHPDKVAISPLKALNDEVVRSGYFRPYTIFNDVYIFILPVVGTVCYRVNGGEIINMEVGKAAFIKLCKGDLLEFSNPFEKELINFIHAWFESSLLMDITELQVCLSENQLISIADLSTVNKEIIKIFLGKFTGREKHSMLTERNKNYLAFAIEGAFEFQDRLLLSRDSLLLCNANELEFEALSAYALIMLIAF